MKTGRARGFTLLEVLVALVIVALGMGALLTALGQSAGNVAALRERTVAEWIAMNQITLARLSLTAPGVGTTRGEVTDCGHADWAWEQQVAPVNAIPGLMSITVSVRRLGRSDANDHGADASGRASPPGLAPHGPLAAAVPLGPTAPLGSVQTLSSGGCASAASPGGSLANSDETAGNSSDTKSTTADSTDSPDSADSSSGSGADSLLTRPKPDPGHSWAVTLTGFRGNTLGAASGESPDWNGSAFAGQGGTQNAPGRPTNGGSTLGTGAVPLGTTANPSTGAGTP